MAFAIGNHLPVGDDLFTIGLVPPGLIRTAGKLEPHTTIRLRMATNLTGDPP
jgi:hypothetical protein